MTEALDLIIDPRKKKHANKDYLFVCICVFPIEHA